MSPIRPASDRWQLRRPGATPTPAVPVAATPQPPARRGVLLVGIGNSGETAVLKLRAHAWRDGFDLPALGLNNDAYGPTPIILSRPGEPTVQVAATDRFVIGAEGNPRDQLRDFPLLVERYLTRGLLRGIPVFETYNRGLRGGHSIPAITAMDMDLHIDGLYAYLRRSLQWLGGDQRQPSAASDLEALLVRRAQRQATAAETWTIVVVGGGTGSCGNAGHQLVPYLVRHLLAEMAIVNYELWGVVLGPKAFAGLTAYVQHNFMALLHALEYQAHHGQRRRYLNGVTVDTDAPPYDRLWLFDDPLLPGEEATVTERELDRFLDRTALSLHLLLNTRAYDAIASHTANPLDMVVDSRVRWLHTASSEIASVDRAALQALVAQRVEARLLEQFVTRLAA